MHLALDHEQMTLVALKHPVLHWPDLEGDERRQLRDRLHREHQVARDLVGSRRIIRPVAFHDEANEQGWPLAVFEYLPGPTLETVLRERPLDEDELWWTATALLEAASELHGHNVIHRDIKPGNFAVEALKLFDLGVAWDPEAPLLTSTDIRHPGTLSYSAPEIDDGVVTRQSDLYSIGITLAEAATRQHPFGPTSGIRHANIRTLAYQPDLSGLPTWLQPLVRQCLSHDAAARPATADAALTLLPLAPPTLAQGLYVRQGRLQRELEAQQQEVLRHARDAAKSAAEAAETKLKLSEVETKLRKAQRATAGTPHVPKLQRSDLALSWFLWMMLPLVSAIFARGLPEPWRGGLLPAAAVAFVGLMGLLVSEMVPEANANLAFRVAVCLLLVGGCVLVFRGPRDLLERADLILEQWWENARVDELWGEPSGG